MSEPLSSQLEGRGEDSPFTLGVRDGVVRTNIYFQQNMQGNIRFVVQVNDSTTEHFDRANVSVSTSLMELDLQLTAKSCNSCTYTVSVGCKPHFCQIYLLNEAQRVKVVIRGDPNEVAEWKDHFAEFISNITQAVINVDLIRTHMDSSGKPDTRKYVSCPYMAQYPATLLVPEYV